MGPNAIILVLFFTSVTESCPTHATPWTAAHQASLSITNFRSPPKLMSIAWTFQGITPTSKHLNVIKKEIWKQQTNWLTPSSHLILWCPLLCPQSFSKSGTFLMSCLFTSDGQNTGASDWVSVFAVNMQGWSPLRLTGLISLLFKGLSGVFSSTTVWRHQFLTFCLLYSRGYHALITWLSCTDHVADHAMIT